jgi:hypothetical protein
MRPVDGRLARVTGASLAACSLAFSAGLRRRLAIAGKRRARLMIAGLSVVFGWSSAVFLVNLSAPLSDLSSGS